MPCVVPFKIDCDQL